MTPFTVLQTQIILDIIKAYEHQQISGERLAQCLTDLGYHFAESTLNKTKTGAIPSQYIVVHNATTNLEVFKPWEV